MNDKKMLGVGVPTLMVAITMLALTAFAALSLVSAGADLRMSRRLASSAQAYATANAQAERVLAQADEAYLVSGMLDTQALGQQFALLSVQMQGDILSFQVPVDERHALQVRLRWQTGGDTRYTIDQWLLVDTQNWEEKPQGLPVWTGEDGGAT